MSTTQTHLRRLSVVAAAACGVVALSACSGGSSAGQSSSATTTSSSSTSSTSMRTVPKTSGTPSGSRSVLQSGSSSSKASSTSGKPSSSSPSKSTAAKPKTDPVAACKAANTKSNAAIGQWNTAVDSQAKSKLDAAANNFRTTAKDLRKLPAKAGQPGFTSRVKAVASDLDTMATNRFAGKTVDPSTYNADSEKLRSYCQKVLTTQ